jgi:SAM-dependent methyltransferase
MLNKDHYLINTGDRYYARRKHDLEEHKKAFVLDPIYIAVKALGLEGSYLEVGCANGWRFDLLGLDCWGIEPSQEAISGNDRIVRGTADNLPFQNSSFDIVCMGFCLYACDPCDLFKIAHEADRVTKKYIIVYDFMVDGFIYKQNPDCQSITTLKMDYSKMFDWHPLYRKIYQRRHTQITGTGDVEVSVFGKNINN